MDYISDQILNKVRNVDPNNSDAIKETLLLFFQKLPKNSDANCIKWLREMRNVIDRYPKYCMSHRINIETYFVRFLSSSNYYRIIEVAKCAHSLQQVRLAKEKTATPKSSWRDQISLLCGAVNTLISAIFPNAVDIYKDIDTAKKVKEEVKETAKSPLTLFLAEVTKLTKSAKDKQTILHSRIKNVFILIQAMLVETYPVAKPVQPRSILDVIVRALSVTGGASHDDNVALLKIEALRTLDALIMCLGSNLIPLSPLVFRSVMHTLRWSSDNPSESNSKVRIAAYSTLTNWLTTLHIHRISENRSLENELSSHIMNDVIPQKRIVELTLGPQPTKHMSKKAKRKLATTQLQESSISSHMPGEKNKISISEVVNNEVAMAALECAETFLNVCGRFLKPDTHKLFQEIIVRESFNYKSYEEDYVLSLLHVLEASRKSTPNSIPPPTQYCLHLYSMLVNTQNNQISKFCTEAILNIRLHLHCSPPTLTFAMDVPQETEKTVSKRKTISEKNRAALEALLGKGRALSKETADDDIITIPEEPSKKKPRLEDTDDKISLSSDDIEPSVEISDDSEDDMIVEVLEVSGVVENDLQNKVSEVSNKNYDENDATVMTLENKSQNDENLLINNETQVESVKEVDLQETNHDLQTQLAENVPISDPTDEIETVEVGYDSPNTDMDNDLVLETLGGNNIPSSNETDDIQIACGQKVPHSQDLEEEPSNNKEDEKMYEGNKCNGSDSIVDSEVPKMNGDVQSEDIIQNGYITNNIDNVDSAKTDDKIEKNNVSVEDMLADFVDEANEEAAEAFVIN